MADYVKFETPKELANSQLALIEKARKGGKIRLGSNEVTKAIERGNAKLVVIAQDVSPPEVVMHLPLLCEEKKIPYGYVETKKELGEKAGMKVGTSAVAVENEGDAKKELEDIVKKLAELKK
ncbi:50S ribosomal protein L7Ae [Candidatus Micrarchaeota archaeon]|nr:50S ribosomal protein L7Ae [Candidatus Micrarchaeota archaeon]